MADGQRIKIDLPKVPLLLCGWFAGGDRTIAEP